MVIKLKQAACATVAEFHVPKVDVVQGGWGND